MPFHPSRASADSWWVHQTDRRSILDISTAPLRPSSATAWPLFYASSQDGRQFTARQRIPTDGFAHHPQVALVANGDVMVTWDEQTSDGRRVSVAVARGTVDDKGTAVFERREMTNDARGQFPAMVVADDGAVIAWSAGAAGKTVIRVARVAR